MYDSKIFYRNFTRKSDHYRHKTLSTLLNKLTVFPIYVKKNPLIKLLIYTVSGGDGSHEGANAVGMC